MDAFFRYERPFGEFTRSVALPEGTDDVEARAHYANGVLEVHVEKREQSKPRRSRSRRPSRAVPPTSLHRRHVLRRGGLRAVSRLAILPLAGGDRWGHRPIRSTQMNVGTHSTTDLDWQGFVTAYFPGSRRHDLKAITAYATYNARESSTAVSDRGQPLERWHLKAPCRSGKTRRRGAVAEDHHRTDRSSSWSERYVRRALAQRIVVGSR